MISSRFLKSRISENNDKIEFSTEDFYSIRDYIYEKSGIYFQDIKKEFVENRVVKRVNENSFNSFKEYYYFLKYNTSDYEIKVLMDALTINETKFFRDIPLLKTFEDIVKKDIYEEKIKKGDRSLKILSAGCSTGEEPYTLAMILNEIKNEIKGIDFKITAGDISEEVLNSAKKGIYKETQFRSTEEKYIQKYFKKDTDNNYKIDFTLKSNINFIYLNLAESQNLRKLGKFDIIFCRNVMIYFDNMFKRKLVKDYYEMLNNKGYFFVGHSESLFGINNDFKISNVSGNIVYKKEEK